MTKTLLSFVAVSPSDRRKFLGLALVAATALLGCEKDVGITLPPPSTKPVVDANISDDELKARVDAAIKTTADRVLDLSVNNAWQVVHGILAYGNELQMVVDKQGTKVPALRWLFEGNGMPGWDLSVTPNGIKAALVPGSSKEQGHPDQWIGYLSQCGIKLDDPIVVTVAEKKETHKFREMIEQAKWDCGEIRLHGQPTQELTWTLMAFAQYSSDDYLPLDVAWKNRRGEDWTFEKIMGLEADAGIEGAACGGSHRLYALAEALQKYRAKNPGKPLTGGWAKADKLLADSVRAAREYQQPDGGFSTNKFQRSSISADADARIDSTGHVLEVLAYALSDEDLKSPWFTRAVLFLTKTIEDTKAVSVSCGGLYHGAHGLMIYRERRFGKPASVAAE